MGNSALMQSENYLQKLANNELSSYYEENVDVPNEAHRLIRWRMTLFTSRDKIIRFNMVELRSYSY